MVKRKSGTPRRKSGGAGPRGPSSVFEPGEQRLRLDDLFVSVALEEGDVEGTASLGNLTFPPSSARVLGWTISVSAVHGDVQFRTGVGHAKTARVVVPCGFPRPAAAPAAPPVALVGPENTTFGVFGSVTVFYKPQ